MLDQGRAERHAGAIGDIHLVSRMMAERTHESLERPQLRIRGHTEVHARYARERTGQMLPDGTEGELPQRSAPRRAVAGPTGGCSQVSAPGRRRQRTRLNQERPGDTEQMRDGAQDARLVEAIGVDNHQAELTQQPGPFQPCELAVVLEHEQRIVSREPRDVGRIDGVVVVGRVTGTAGPAIAVEGLGEKQLSAVLNQILVRSGDRHCHGQRYGPAYQLSETAKDEHRRIFLSWQLALLASLTSDHPPGICLGSSISP